MHSTSDLYTIRRLSSVLAMGSGMQMCTLDASNVFSAFLEPYKTFSTNCITEIIRVDAVGGVVGMLENIVQ